MKRTPYSARTLAKALPLLLGVGVLVGATGIPAASADEPKPMKKASETMEETGDYLVKKKNDFAKWVDGKLETLEEKQETTEKELEAMSDGAKTQWEAFKVDMANRRAVIVENLKEAKDASADKWDTVKVETEEAVEALETRYNAFLNKLKTEG